MSLNPLAPVSDYQSMLNRIFWFTTASALFAIGLLRSHIPTLDGWLGQIDFPLALGGDAKLPAPGGSLLPALAIGMAARIFRLHGVISDWLGIRECFDVEVILRELADRSAPELPPAGDQQLRKARHELMRKTFYAYVSGSQPTIDAYLVQQALDAWSWLWVGVESTLLWALAGYGLIAAGATIIGLRTLAAVVVFAILGLPTLRGQCKRYAVAQVRAILADPARAEAVRAVFQEQTVERLSARRAA